MHAVYPFVHQSICPSICMYVYVRLTTCISPVSDLPLYSDPVIIGFYNLLFTLSNMSSSLTHSDAKIKNYNREKTSME